MGDLLAPHYAILTVGHAVSSTRLVEPNLSPLSRSYAALSAPHTRSLEAHRFRPVRQSSWRFPSPGPHACSTDCQSSSCCYTSNGGDPLRRTACLVHGSAVCVWMRVVFGAKSPRRPRSWISSGGISTPVQAACMQTLLPPSARQTGETRPWDRGCACGSEYMLMGYDTGLMEYFVVRCVLLQSMEAAKEGSAVSTDIIVSEPPSSCSPPLCWCRQRTAGIVRTASMYRKNIIVCMSGIIEEGCSRVLGSK